MLLTGTRTSLYTNRETGVVDYEKMHREGYSACDFSKLTDTKGVLYTLTEAEFISRLEKEKEAAKESGIIVSQVHAPWPVENKTEEQRRETMRFMKRAVIGTKALGSRNLVVHPVMPYGWDPEPEPSFAHEVNAAYFAELCDYAAPYDVDICIENMPTTRHHLARVPALCDFIGELARKNFFMCIDTGHCSCIGDDCGDMIRICGPRLKALHVHDNKGRYDDHLMPYFGVINWKNFKKALADIGFTGVLSLEADVPFLPEPLREKAFALASETARFLADIHGRDKE